MKVLVVEDEPKLASFLKMGLEEQSCEVQVAYDGLVPRQFSFYKIVHPHLECGCTEKRILNTPFRSSALKMRNNSKN